MIRKKSLIIWVLLAALMVLTACGGGASEGSSPTDTSGSNSTGATEGEDVGSEPARMKVREEEGPAARGAAGPTSDVAGVCLSPAEAELARLINEYRASVGLPAVPLSKSLTLVAQQHAWDSVNNSNAWPAPPPGQQCNMHSWSGNVNPALQQGTWTAVCYTPDHANMALTHRKPLEIAGFAADGFENSHWASAGASPAGALNGWKNSPGHNALITEQDGWGPLLALGVGINGQYAHMWAAEVADPAGPPEVCGGGAVVQPTAAPPTAAPTVAAATAEPTAAAATAEPTVAAATAEPTAAAATAAPTAAPTTAPTGGSATGEVLNQAGTVAAGGSAEHTFEIAQGRRYTVVVTPAAELDAALAFVCTTANSSRSGTIDQGWEGEAESFAHNATGNGTCKVTVSGYEGSAGPYTIVVTAQ